MGFCKRRLLVSWFCFLLTVVPSFLFWLRIPSPNYSKLESPASNTRKLVLLEEINVSVSKGKKACRRHGQVFILQLITSHAGNYKLRSRMRREFNSSELAKLNVRRVFLIGQTPPASSASDMMSNGAKFSIPLEHEIQEESQVSGDLLLGTFVEAYRNLTYKHVMGLQWASDHCSQAQFLLKQDDDIFVDLHNLVARLRNSPLGTALKSRKAIYGKVLQNRRAIRDPGSKWFVTQEEFGSELYPSFVSGWAYVTTPSTIRRLLQGLETLNFFWIDDVFITGILRYLPVIPPYVSRPIQPKEEMIADYD